MGTAAQRLEKLDKEAATLAAEGKDATDAWSGATDLQQAADLKEEYEYLKEKVKRLDSRLAKLEARLPVAGASSPARARAAGSGLQNFWTQLAAVQQLSMVGSAQLLQLGNGACFPGEFKSSLLVRQCYVELSQMLHDYFAAGGRSFIITGNEGIGKSLFLYFLMWQLARSGRTIVWDRLLALSVLMFSPEGVLAGDRKDFKQQLADPQTWYLVDGQPPVCTAAKTVLVASDWVDYKEAKKRPDSLLRHMPVWTLDEIQAAHQHIFTSQLETDVADRYSRWGGIPRYVLELTDVGDQALLKTALQGCSLRGLPSSMSDLSSASNISYMLLHRTVEDGYLGGPVVFASDWVQGELISRYLQFRRREVHDFLAVSGGEPTLAAFRGKLWERYAHVALQRGGSFSCRDLQDAQAGPFQIELQPCSSSVGLWDVQDTSTGLGDGVYGYGRNKTLPAINAVVQPDKLFQITVSGDHKSHTKGLANAVHAMHAQERDVELYFVVPPDVFSSYTKQTLKRIRGDVARAVKQFVLKLEI